MPDYKEMYLIMMRATEKAIQIIIEAQQKCEEMFIEPENPSLALSAQDKVPAAQERRNPPRDGA